VLLVGACGGGDGGGSADASGSSEASNEAGGTQASATVGDGTGSQTTTTAGSVDTGTATSEDTGAKFDVAVTNDMPGGECGCGSELEFSYIWVANSGESTVSKINTTNLVEEGRYRTRADSAGNPSRTSVSLSGRAVAVANRNGGVVKIWSIPDLCDEMANGVPGVQTSTGAGDVLAWGQEDCVAWYAPFDYNTQRPVAWAPGDLDPTSCEYGGERLWTAGCLQPGDAGSTVHRLDGDTGAVLDTVYVADFDCNLYNGPYGGASDQDGNFWMIHTGVGKLTRVDAVTLESQTWDVPPLMWTYGITVDHQGRPVVSSSGDYGPGFVAGPGGARFDPDTESWDLFEGEFFRSIGGLQQDGAGRLWVAQWDIDGQPPAVRQVDADTLAVGPSVTIEGTVKGISVDVDGYVWAVTQIGRAYKIDPDDFSFEYYAGLSGPYTYSDMTGWALQNVSCTPEG
jgi:hypothetical protein